MILNNDWRTVYSMNEGWEMDWLERKCKAHYEQCGRELTILEIGSFHGQSTVLMANWGIVFSIDLFSNVDDGLMSYKDIGQGHFVSFIQTLIRFKLIDRIFPIVSTSDVLKSLPHMNFDIIFIDASHKYEEARKDINNSFGHLKDDGLLVCHDAYRSGWGYPPYDPANPNHGPVDPWAGVGKAVQEFLDLGEFGVDDHYYGIVSLRRREYITKTIREPIETPTFNW